MQDFVRFRIPVSVRRLVTMVPAVAVVAAGVAPTDALVLSQVVLSLVLPVPMVALLILVQRKSLMGDFAIRRATKLIATVAAVVVMGLNVILLLQSAGISPDLFPSN